MVGVQARLMSQALRKLAGAISKYNCIAIFINQLREKIGVFYGSNETTTGGRALKFYASVRLDIRKAEAIKNGSDIIGSHTKVKVVKNKVAPPFKTAEFDIMYGKGISKEGELIDLATDLGIMKRSGAWFYYGELRMAQGRDNAKVYLNENPEIFEEIYAKVMETMLAKNTPDAEKSSTDTVDVLDPVFPAEEKK
jgi:recombination protein RecA